MAKRRGKPDKMGMRKHYICGRPAVGGAVKRAMEEEFNRPKPKRRQQWFRSVAEAFNPEKDAKP